MRVVGLILSAAVLVGIVGHCLRLLQDPERMSRTSPWHYVGLLVAVVVAVVIFSESQPARQRRQDRHDRPPRESLLRLCSVGLMAWVLVLLLFLGAYVVPHVTLPDAIVETVPFAVFWLPFGLLFTVPMFLLLSTGIGILAIGKAKSVRAKWTVALVYFSPPLGFVAWWLTVWGT